MLNSKVRAFYKVRQIYNFAKGYRIYFKEKNGKIIILLIGGDKSTQQKDIKKAKEPSKPNPPEKNNAPQHRI